MLTLKILDRNDPCVPILSEINNEAFPEYERLDMSDMFGLTNDTKVIGYFENETPVGFTMLVCGNGCAYLYYLAIRKDLRGKGYGSDIIRLLLEEFKGIQITLDFEELNPNSENYSQRVRRKAFYLKNGLIETGRFTILNGNRFELVCSEKKLNENGLMEIIHEIHQVVPEFADELI